jgi:PAS domain S-box-containing protein
VKTHSLYSQTIPRLWCIQVSLLARLKPKLLWNYATAIALVLAALLLMLALDPVVEFRNSLLLFHFSLTLAAWYGGYRLGLFTTFLSAVVADYFFVEPRFSFFITLSGGLRLLIFLIQGSLVSFLVGSLRTTQQQAKRSLHLREQADVNLQQTLETQQQIEQKLLEQTRLLEIIATDQLLEDCLKAICTSVSELSVPTRACFLLADAQREFFSHCIAPDFPASFGKALQNAPINEFCIGTCGEAVYRNKPIACTDIAQDDRWSENWRNLCLQHGIRACYSQPVLTIDGLPLGSLMLCFAEAQSPTEWDYQLADFGTQVASIVFERDRTSQAKKQTEGELYLRRDRLKFVLKTTGIGLWLNPMPLQQLNWDTKTRELFFVAPEVEPTIELFWSRLHPDDHEPTRLALEEALQQQTLYEIDHRAVHPNTGEIRWIRSAGKATYAADGTPIRFDGMSYDISALKASEADLRQKNAILDVINEFAPTPIFVKNRQGQLIYANPATLKVVGKSAEEVIGAWDCDLYPNPEDAARVMENDQRIMETGQAEVVEESPDGIRTFLGTKTPYHNEAGEVIGLIGISNDISDRVQFERDRERVLQQEQAARQAAEAANRIKDEFLAVLSHELRSPLNPILGWSKLLQSQVFTPEETAQALESIERNAKLQAQLIEDLLDVSRILRGKMALNIRPVNLVSVIKSAIETVHLAAEVKGIEIQVSLDKQVGHVSGDSARLQQIIWNLLTNAVKFTPQDGKIDIKLTQVGSCSQIQVKDTGKGIKPDFLPYVFDYFRQEDGAITRKFGGLGLGLAIVRHLTEQHGGTITVESAGEGQGATFIVSLPLQSTTADLSPEKGIAPQHFDLSPLKILVVDDEADMRDLMKVILTSYGIQVQVVGSAEEALTLLDSWQPDALVSDIGMPEMDGYNLLQHIRRLPPERGGQIPAIALTAYAGEFDQKQAFAAGFQQHISKPVEPEHLIQAIATLVKPHLH